ncbi:MAG: hypothetical protein RIC56_11130 [Pseudomonadales bacterium]
MAVWEKWRIIAEAIGLAALLLSLAFIGYEIKLTREMNLAQLHASRATLEHSRFIAMLESDHAVAFWSKQYPDLGWDHAGLTPEERAAAEMRAFALWHEYKLEFKFIELGFETRDLEALRTDIVAMSTTNPEMVAVWKRWWYFPSESDPFIVMVNQALSKTGVELDDGSSVCRIAGNC